MNRNGTRKGTKQTRFTLSQETITIVTVGVALAGMILMVNAEIRAEQERTRAEARADREAFASQIIRLVEQQGTLNGLVDGLRQAIPHRGSESRGRPMRFSSCPRHESGDPKDVSVPAEHRLNRGRKLRLPPPRRAPPSPPPQAPARRRRPPRCGRPGWSRDGESLPGCRTASAPCPERRSRRCGDPRRG